VMRWPHSLGWGACTREGRVPVRSIRCATADAGARVRSRLREEGRCRYTSCAPATAPAARDCSSHSAAGLGHAGEVKRTGARCPGRTSTAQPPSMPLLRAGSAGYKRSALCGCLNRACWAMLATRHEWSKSGQAPRAGAHGSILLVRRTRPLCAGCRYVRVSKGTCESRAVARPLGVPSRRLQPPRPKGSGCWAEALLLCLQVKRMWRAICFWSIQVRTARASVCCTVPGGACERGHRNIALGRLRIVTRQAADEQGAGRHVGRMHVLAATQASSMRSLLLLPRPRAGVAMAACLPAGGATGRHLPWPVHVSTGALYNPTHKLHTRAPGTACSQGRLSWRNATLRCARSWNAAPGWAFPAASPESGSTGRPPLRRSR
jgi:hypothetical protein